MKLIDVIEAPTPKVFAPFTLSIQIESEPEARLLWHVFNHFNLKQVVQGEEDWYSLDQYSPDLAPRLCSAEIREAIEDRISII